MIFVYDILVNFNDEVYSFYEWEEKDEIEFLKKSLLIKVSDFLYKRILSNNIIFDITFLNSIKNKSEILKNKKVEVLEYMCIFSNGRDLIGIIFNDKGKFLEKTKFTIQDEIELLDICSSLKTKKISYTVVKNEYNPSFITRRGKKIINNIIRELKEIKNDKDKLKYLYYEWFNSKKYENDYYAKLIEDIKLTYNEKHDDFLNLLNKISIKNNV